MKLIQLAGCVAAAFALVPFASAQDEGSDSADRLTLTRDFVFSSADGGPVTIEPGTYRVEVTPTGALRLSPSGAGDSLALAAEHGTHEQPDVASPTALLIPSESGTQARLMLLLPNGDIAISLGSASGVTSRAAPRPVTYQQLSSARRSRLSAATAARVPRLTDASAVQRQRVAMPDLTITDCQIRCKDSYQLGYYPADGCAGGYTSNLIFGIYATLKNQGLADAIFEPGALVSDVDPTDPDSSGVGYPAAGGGFYLAAGAQRSGNESYTPRASLGMPPPGTVGVTFTADPHNHIAESNESNNSLLCEIDVAPSDTAPPAPPDFTLTAVSVNPSSGPPEAGFVISATIRNGGESAAFGTVRVQCDLGGSKDVTGLAADESKTITMNALNYPLPPGTRTATCTADPYDSHEETNESNNSRSQTFTVTSD